VAPRTDAPRQFRALISGRVQGVGFRYWVRDHAARLGLKGWTRNLESGIVEVVAVGPPDALGRLLGLLHEGPALAWVERVNVEWQTPDLSLQTFQIRSTSW
jgi:acylphosphatase